MCSIQRARAAARFAAVLPQGKVPAKDARLDGAFPKAGRTLMHCATMLPHAHGKIAAELVKVIATSTTALLAPSTGANARAFDEAALLCASAAPSFVSKIC